MKKRNKDELKEYLFAHPLFEKITSKYPDRDYDLQFEMMIEHHLSGSCKCHKGGGLPKNIVAAWNNWIPYTKADEFIILARQKKMKEQQERQSMVQAGVNPEDPVDPEKKAKVDAIKAQLRERFGRKIS